MAREQATVGTEEHLRRELRDVLATRIGSGDDESFVLDLMDIELYARLTDESRASMLKLIDGYTGASATWNGVILPVYRYKITERPHHVAVTYS